MVFTSTAEVEGLLKSFKEFGLDWEMAKKRCPKMLVAAHGPITAAGAHMLGVRVDLVQPCGELDLGKKCSLVSEYMPKISAAFLDEASKWLNGEGKPN
ncbi:hypothetical protein ACE6H2_016123 [Prunus campanulata]